MRRSVLWAEGEKEISDFFSSGTTSRPASDDLVSRRHPHPNLLRLHCLLRDMCLML